MMHAHATSALPQPPDHLLTIAEYTELGEPDFGYTELVEGRLLMSPSPGLKHNAASLELAIQLRAQLPEDLVVFQDIDVNLEISGPDKPGFSRRPDLVVVPRVAQERVYAEGGLLRASEVVLIIEIVSPGSRHLDYVAKRGEYADAGIVHYWIVDLDPPLSLLALHLTAEFGYVDGSEATGEFTATEPFAARLQLDQLI